MTGQTEGTSLLGSGCGCDRGNVTNKHPRDVRPTDRRHCHRKNFPATFPATGFVAFFGYFQQVSTKDGVTGRKMHVLGPRKMGVCVGTRILLGPSLVAVYAEFSDIPRCPHGHRPHRLEDGRE